MNQDNQTTSENKMGTMPVGKLLIQMAVPMMISMTVQALYNIVDSYFVAQINQNALTAVSFAFPIQSLMIAFATGTGVGINSLLSMRLGQKNFQAVNQTAENGIFLSICTTIVFIIMGCTIPQMYFESQTQDLQIIQYGVSYLKICLIGSVGLFVGIIFERLLQSTGRTLFSMIAQLSGALTNIIFDPIMIFGLFGCPAFGIGGAALATVMGQIVTLIVAIILNVKKNHEIKFAFKHFRPSLPIIGQIYRVGVPSILLASIGSVMTYFMNKILGSFSMTAVAVFGIYFKLQSFVFMPVFGMNNALVPIIAYNFGARHKRRIINTIKAGMLIGLVIMTLGTLAFEIFPTRLLSIFKASTELLFIGTKALRIIGIHFPVAAVCIVCMSVFQSLGRGVMSMTASFTRQIIVLLPAAYLLSLTGDVNNIWWSFPIAEIASLIISATFMIILYKKGIKHLPE